jgi:hypothetical protein
VKTSRLTKLQKKELIQNYNRKQLLRIDFLLLFMRILEYLGQSFHRHHHKPYRKLKNPLSSLSNNNSWILTTTLWARTVSVWARLYMRAVVQAKWSQIVLLGRRKVIHHLCIRPKRQDLRLQVRKVGKQSPVKKAAKPIVTLWKKWFQPHSNHPRQNSFNNLLQTIIRWRTSHHYKQRIGKSKLPYKMCTWSKMPQLITQLLNIKQSSWLSP